MSFPDRAGFEALIGTELPVEDGDGFALRITAVDPGSHGAFSVLLEGPADPVLEQAAYPLQIPGHGTEPTFVVPIGADGDGATYEAVFTPGPPAGATPSGGGS